MFVLFVGPPVLTGPLWCGPKNPRTALRSLGVAPKTGPQRSGPVWFAVLAVPFRGLLPQQRMSGRVRKRPRLLEGYEVQ